MDNGGVFFDAEDEVWNLLKESGIDPWKVNEQFLRNQLEAGVDRIDFFGEDILDIINSENPNIRNSYRAKEIRWLIDNAEDFEYARKGNSWILEP